MELYHWSRKNKDIFSHSIYPRGVHRGGFWWETAQLPKESSQWLVYIHHRFVVIDGETSYPTIYRVRQI